MPRLNRFQIMDRNKDLIAETFLGGSGCLSLPEIAGFVDRYKPEWSLPNKTSLNEILAFLNKNDILREVIIKLPKRMTTRYIWGSPSVYEIALSLNKKSYLTHYSALFLNGMTNNVTKTIYTNVEQTSSWSTSYSHDDDEDDMPQKNIDIAFSRPMRKTNQIAEFQLDGIKYHVYMLNGKNHGQLGVKNHTSDDMLLPITDIERTLIDIVVRPNYAGGVEEVLEAFESAKSRFSVNKLTAYLKKMDFKYPYHQLIGFYLEKAGYKDEILRLFDKFEIKYDFYLTYQMKDKDFSDRWRVYYPKGWSQ